MSLRETTSTAVPPAPRKTTVDSPSTTTVLPPGAKDTLSLQNSRLSARTTTEELDLLLLCEDVLALGAKQAGP